MRILVIGGSGMLRACCVSLAQAGHEVTVGGRRAERLAWADDLGAARFAGDYTDPAFWPSLAALGSRRRFEGLVAWVHGADPERTGRMIDVLRPHGLRRCLQVLGSAGADPSGGLLDAFVASNHTRGVTYATAVLGFVREGGRSRWLHDAEISAGVFEAWESERVASVVGVVRPWSHRP